MKHKCEICGKPATIHLTEMISGQQLEKHFCEDCASSEGITIKANLPISQLLEDFVLQAADMDDDVEIHTPAESKCAACGLTFGQFKEGALLGCSNDYDAFEDELTPIIARNHSGKIRHIGKVPHSADQKLEKHNRIIRLRAELNNAVQIENYERAAQLRDEIKEIEQLNEIH